jgi:hypothetical protein
MDGMVFNLNALNLDDIYIYKWAILYKLYIYINII